MNKPLETDEQFDKRYKKVVAKPKDYLKDKDFVEPLHLASVIYDTAMCIFLYLLLIRIMELLSFPRWF